MRHKLSLFLLALIAIPAYGQTPHNLESNENGLTRHISAGATITRGQLVKTSGNQVVPVTTSDTFGVYGASLYHTVYVKSASCTTPNNAIFLLGQNCPYGNVPTDTLVNATALRYGNYDTVTAAIRFCGNSLNTNWSSAGNCNSVSESPSSASTYPSTPPVYGDTAKGQAAATASFYLAGRPSWYSSSITFPPIGPDVTSGNLGQCGGTINTNFAGMPATSSSQCAGQGFNSLWGGHANAIPALACALNTMGMPPDGSGNVLTFNPSTCYTGAAPPQGPTISPPSVLFAKENK